MRIHVSVTSEDIAQGLRGSTVKCPAARAIRRALEAAGIGERFDGACAVHLHFKSSFEMPLPGAVQRFIRSFDHDQPVEPFEFDLDVPEKVVA